jgi:hypothetical protein
MTNIEPAAPYPGPATTKTCALIDVGCLGKVDADADVDPYGEEQATGGCSTTTPSSGFLLAIFWVAARRRRGSARRRSASPQL